MSSNRLGLWSKRWSLATKTPTRPGPPRPQGILAQRCYGNQALLTKKATEPRRGGERVSPIASLGASRAARLEISVGGGLFCGRGRRSAGRGQFQPLVDSVQHQLQAVRDAQLVIDRAQVILDRLLGDGKVSRDFAISPALHQITDDGLFPVRQGVAGTNLLPLDV